MKWLTLNHKGQGLTEYGIILLLILGVGMGVYFGSGYKGDLGEMYDNVYVQLNRIVNGGYDTGDEPYVQTYGKNGSKVFKGPYKFHKTVLNYDGAGYDGTKDKYNKGQTNDTSIWWFINGDGYKEYKVGKANSYSEGMLQWVPNQFGHEDNTIKGYTNSDGTTNYSTYFKASDGRTYQITYYQNNPTGTTLTEYTGDSSSLKLINDYTSFTGFPSNSK